MTTNIEQRLREPAFHKLISKLKAAREVKKRVEERVRELVAPLLASYAFKNDLDCTGEVITDSDKLYLSDDEDRMPMFFLESDTLFRDKGMLDASDEFGVWPELKAALECNKIEQMILDICPEYRTTNLEHYKRFFDLLLKIHELTKED